jgi:hypothetical protein
MSVFMLYELTNWQQMMHIFSLVYHLKWYSILLKPKN